MDKNCEEEPSSCGELTPLYGSHQPGHTSSQAQERDSDECEHCARRQQVIQTHPSVELSVDNPADNQSNPGCESGHQKQDIALNVGSEMRREEKETVIECKSICKILTLSIFLSIGICIFVHFSFPNRVHISEDNKESAPKHEHVVSSSSVYNRYVASLNLAPTHQHRPSTGNTAERVKTWSVHGCKECVTEDGFNYTNMLKTSHTISGIVILRRTTYNARVELTVNCTDEQQITFESKLMSKSKGQSETILDEFSTHLNCPQYGVRFTMQRDVLLSKSEELYVTASHPDLLQPYKTFFSIHKL